MILNLIIETFVVNVRFLLCSIFVLSLHWIGAFSKKSAPCALMRHISLQFHSCTLFLQVEKAVSRVKRQGQVVDGTEELLVLRLLI